MAAPLAAAPAPAGGHRTMTFQAGRGNRNTLACHPSAGPGIPLRDPGEIAVLAPRRPRSRNRSVAVVLLRPLLDVDGVAPPGHESSGPEEKLREELPLRLPSRSGSSSVGRGQDPTPDEREPAAPEYDARANERKSVPRDADERLAIDPPNEGCAGHPRMQSSGWRSGPKASAPEAKGERRRSLRPIDCAPPRLRLPAPPPISARTAFVHSVGPADEEAGRLLEPAPRKKLRDSMGGGSRCRGCESGEKRMHRSRLGEPDVRGFAAVPPVPTERCPPARERHAPPGALDAVATPSRPARGVSRGRAASTSPSWSGSGARPRKRRRDSPHLSTRRGECARPCRSARSNRLGRAVTPS